MRSISMPALPVHEGFLAVVGFEGNSILARARQRPRCTHSSRSLCSANVDFVIGLGFVFSFGLFSLIYLLDSPSSGSIRNQKQIMLHEESLLFEQLRHPLGQKNMCFVFH